jgi:hypothetical protein
MIRRRGLRKSAMRISDRLQASEKAANWKNSAVRGGSPQPLDVAALVAHCPAMYGLNQICGICREIIR